MSKRTVERMQTPHPVHTDRMAWIPLSDGLSFKPIVFFPDDAGYQLLLRIEPGCVIPRHRHTGEVHALTLSGVRRLDGLHDDIGPGTYLHEPVGNVDSWRAVGDEPCIVFIEANGRVEYLGDDDSVVRHTDAATARAEYLRWCSDHHVEPDALLATRTPA